MTYYDVDRDVFVSDVTPYRNPPYRVSDTYLLVGRKTTLNAIFASLTCRLPLQR